MSRIALAGLMVLLAQISAAPTPAAERRDPDVLPEEANFLFGEEPATTPGPTPRTADGHPDFSGYWKGSRATTPVGNIGKDLPGFQLPLTPAGKAALQHNLTQTVDPEALCIIGGIPRHSASALPFEIVQGSNRLVFLYLYTYFRSIPLDGRKHAEDPDPSFFGDKIGWWEGDTLVIDSVGFKGEPIWIDENANPQSDAMHATERWTRPDASHIHLALTVDDPKFYTKKFTYSRTWLRGLPGEGPREYSCSENNIDRAHLGPGPGPIRKDGTRGYDVPPLPAVPPSPEAYEKPLQQLMQLEVDPPADSIWNSVGTRTTSTGVVERHPQSDADWTALRLQSLKLLEATNLLALPGRPVTAKEFPADGPGVFSSQEIGNELRRRPQEFTAFAQALSATGGRVLAAIDARDSAALFEAGAALDNACEACHVSFWYPHEVIPPLPAEPPPPR